jgi:hypothetical protein
MIMDGETSPGASAAREAAAKASGAPAAEGGRAPLRAVPEIRPDSSSDQRVSGEIGTRSQDSPNEIVQPGTITERARVEGMSDADLDKADTDSEVSSATPNSPPEATEPAAVATTGDAHADLTSIAGESDTAPEALSDHDRAERLGDPLIDKAAARLQAKVDAGLDITDPAKMNDDEYNLLLMHLYKRGFKSGLDIQNLTVQDASGKDVVVTHIEPKAGEEDKTFTSKVEGSDDTVDISREDIAKSHLKRHTESIGKNFSGDAQKIVSWYAEGSQGDPPLSAEQLTKLEESLEPKNAADEAIDKLKDDYVTLKVDSLTKELDGLAADDPKRPDIQKKLDEAKGIYDQLTRAGKLEKGKQMLSAKNNALDGAKQYAEGQGDRVLVRLAQNAMDTLSPDVDAERQSLKEFLKKDHKISDEVLKLADDPSTYLQFLTHPDIAKIPNISQELFGVNEVGEQALLNDHIDNLPDRPEDPQYKEKLKKVLKAGGKGALYTLLIALGVAFVAVAGTTLAATEAAGAGRR